VLLRRARAMHVEARLSFVGELVLSHASAGCEVHISSVISSVLRVGPGLRQGCHRLVLCAAGCLWIRATATYWCGIDALMNSVVCDF
jgi:hypothetical protein